MDINFCEGTILKNAENTGKVVIFAVEKLRIVCYDG